MSKIKGFTHEPNYNRLSEDLQDAIKTKLKFWGELVYITTNNFYIGRYVLNPFIMSKIQCASLQFEPEYMFTAFTIMKVF